MKIAGVETRSVTLPVRGGACVMAHVTQTHLHARLVRITTDSGAFGLGEITRRPTIAPGRAAAQEDPRLAALEGLPVAQIPARIAEWMEEGPLLRGLCFGVDTAFNDLRARARGVPLHRVLGGAVRPFVPCYRPIASAAPGDMAAEAAAHPHHLLQLKLGVHGLSGDMTRVAAVLAAAAPGQRVLADFNGALSAEEALAALPALADPRLIWEDPCLSQDDNATVARALNLPVLFDMCMDGPKAFARVLSGRAAGALALKPQYVGGLTQARRLLADCAEAGMPVRIDGPWSTQVGAAATLHLALTAPRALLLASADLTRPFDAPRALITDPAPGNHGVAEGPGLGPLPGGLFDEGGAP